MNDGGATLALLGRAILSLLLITGLILVAYMVIRRHRTKAGRMPARVAKPAGAGRSGRKPTRQQLVVLSRISTSRTASITALQFGDRVLLVGSNEQSASQVLAEMPLREWEVIETQELDAIPGIGGVQRAGTAGALGAAPAAAGRTPVGNFLEALRTATARHA